MNVLNRSTVVGVFADADRARQAVTELRRRGVGDGAIGVAAREGEVTPFAPHGSHWGVGKEYAAESSGLEDDEHLRRTEAARRLNRGVEALSPPNMPPGV